jgi:hypothetical protein
LRRFVKWGQNGLSKVLLNATGSELYIAQRMMRNLERFAQDLEAFENEWDRMQSEIKYTDDETQDFLHEIELTQFSAVDGYRIAKNLKEVRQRRRHWKTQVEILNHFKFFYDQHKSLKLTLWKLLNSMSKTATDKDSCNRAYKPKVRQDIKLAQVWSELVCKQTEETA